MALVAALGFEFFAVVQECFCVVPVEIEGDHLMVSRDKDDLTGHSVCSA